MTNNTINLLDLESDTCMRRLKEKLKEEDFQECKNFIEERREARHYKTMTRQKEKLKALCSKSNKENSYKRGGRSNNMHSGNGMHSGNYMYSSTNDLPNQVLGSNEGHNQYKEHNNRQNKWVINISNKLLTPDQEKLLAHGPNYAIVPKDPPIIQYVAAVEQACSRLEEGKVEEFRVQVKAAIQNIKKPKPNLTKGERKAIGELKRDQARMILTMDKGVLLVVLNTEDYNKKAEDLLNQNTYRALTSDPTMRLKNKMINLLKSIKSKGGMTEEMYKRLYPTGLGHPNSMGSQKYTSLGCH